MKTDESIVRRSSKREGFAVLQVLWLLVITGIVAGTGWYVYSSNKSSDKSVGGVASSSSAPKTKLDDDDRAKSELKQSATPQPPGTNEFAVPELGVKFTVPDSLSDLTYHVQDIHTSDGAPVIGVYFSTKALSEVAPRCSAHEMGIAALSRRAGQYPKDNPELRYEYGPLLKQFPRAFVTYLTSKADCTNNNAESSKLVSDAMQALSESVKTIELTD